MQSADALLRACAPFVGSLTTQNLNYRQMGQVYTGTHMYTLKPSPTCTTPLSTNPPSAANLVPATKAPLPPLNPLGRAGVQRLQAGVHTPVRLAVLLQVHVAPGASRPAPSRRYGLAAIHPRRPAVHARDRRVAGASGARPHVRAGGVDVVAAGGAPADGLGAFFKRIKADCGVGGVGLAVVVG